MNILVVTNLRSGFGDSGLYDYVRELGTHRGEVTMRFWNEGADLSHLLRDARDYARVVAAGGDGTVSAVAYALRDSGIPLLPYPAGTANLVARNLGIPVDPAQLALATIAGRTVTIDLGELTLPASGGRAARTYGFSIAASTTRSTFFRWALMLSSVGDMNLAFLHWAAIFLALSSFLSVI